jgi:hypothetical protein
MASAPPPRKMAGRGKNLVYQTIHKVTADGDFVLVISGPATSSPATARYRIVREHACRMVRIVEAQSHRFALNAAAPTETSEGLDRHRTFDNLIEGSLPSTISYC